MLLIEVSVCQVKRADVTELAVFKIENGGVFLESTVFVINYADMPAVFQ